MKKEICKICEGKGFLSVPLVNNRVILPHRCGCNPRSKPDLSPRKDKRWTASWCFTGHAKRQAVVRFCGTWIKSFPTMKEARAMAKTMAEERRASL